jgi:hypothetical protein
MAGMQIQSTQLGGVNGAGSLVDTKSLSTLKSSYPSFFSGTSIITILSRVSFDSSNSSSSGISYVLLGNGSQFPVDSQDGDVVVFTSSGTFYPSTSASYRILVIGGGGGGAATIASGGTTSSSWKGGARGAHSIKSTNTVLSGSYTVTVGSGGAGGYTTLGLVLGSSGGASSVSGTNVSMTASGGAGNGSSTVTGESTNITTTSPDNYAAYSGTGGSYTGPNQGITGGNGTNYGAGGGAIYNNDYDSGPSARGGNGAPGLVVFFKV